MDLEKREKMTRKPLWNPNPSVPAHQTLTLAKLGFPRLCLDKDSQILGYLRPTSSLTTMFLSLGCGGPLVQHTYLCSTEDTQSSWVFSVDVWRTCCLSRISSWYLSKLCLKWHQKKAGQMELQQGGLNLSQDKPRPSEWEYLPAAAPESPDMNMSHVCFGSPSSTANARQVAFCRLIRFVNHPKEEAVLAKLFGQKAHQALQALLHVSFCCTLSVFSLHGSTRFCCQQIVCCTWFAGCQWSFQYWWKFLCCWTGMILLWSCF